MRDRLIKSAAAIAGGQGINVLRQLLLPVVFLATLGTEAYGAWLVLCAGLAQLNLLDFGLQTATINKLGMAFHRGRMDEFHRVQSIALRLTLGVVIPATMLVALVLALPVERWLKLALPPEEARWTMLFLAWGILAQIVVGQLVGVFRAINLAWRGQMWGNALRLGSLIVLVVQLLLKLSFPMLALGGLVVSLVVGAAVLVDLRWKARECLPTLRHWDRREAVELVRPSLFFSLGLLNNFLLFEVPLLILQRTSGPQAVVAFSVLRTLLSAGRQLLTPVQYALIPEITRVFALNDKAAMNRLYRLSVEVACLGGAVLNLGLGLGAAGIVALWLQGKVAVVPLLAALLAATGFAAACRESRYLFQLATNRHEHTLVVTALAYVLMLFAGGWLAARYHETGLAFAWLVSEWCILGWMARENLRSLNIRDPRSLWTAHLLVPAIFLVVWGGLVWSTGWSVWLQVGLAGLVACAFALVLLLADRERHGALVMFIYQRFRSFLEGRPAITTTANPR